MGVLVEPKDGSYVTEWEAVQVCGADCYPAVRKLLRGSPWVAQIDLGSGAAAVICSMATPVGLTQERLEPGDWLVKSPHGRFWFMSETEFHDQFTVTL